MAEYHEILEVLKKNRERKKKIKTDQERTEKNKKRYDY